jgi:flagellar basal body-associated protein FliL
MIQQAPAPAKKSNSTRNIVIIVVVAVLLACCACVGISFLYFCGDLLTGKGSCGV